MRYDVGRFRRPMRRSTEGQLMSLISLGDGSTLSLDFTTGVLDSRLTFTRASNATFINSSGLVQWAAANHAPSTNWNFTSPTGSGWNAATTSGTGTFQWVGNGTVIASSGSSGQAFTSITTSTGIAEGLRYVMSVTAQSVTGSPTIQSIFDMTNASGNTYFKNGAAATAGTTVASGDRISVSAVATATTMNVRIGCGAWFANRTNESVTLTQFHWHPGSSPVPYYENTATSPRYDSARFDYDPTTLAPRGLLIEGTATSLGSYSEDFSNAAWTKSGTNGSMVLTGTAPDNNATSRLLEENTTTYVKHSLERSISISAGIHTFSVWLKEPTSNSRRYAHIQLADGQLTAARYTIVADLQTGTITASGANNGTAGAPTGTGHSITAYPNGWYRVTISMNHVSSPSYPTIMLGDTATLFGGNNQPFYSATTPYKGLLAWGAQLEAGSGASSYIPTGASTVQRLADECAIVSPNFAPWFNASAGTLLVSARTATRYVDSAGFDFPAVLTLDSNNQIGPCQWNGVVYGVVRAGGSYRINYATLASPGNNANYKAAIAYANSDYAGVANGGSIQTGSGTTVPSGLNQLALGASRSGVAGNFFGHISQIKFWPTRLPNAQLQSLTT